MNILLNNEKLYCWLEDGELTSCDAASSDLPLLLISNDIRRISVDMPIKQTRQIIKALPFAIEEQIANDVEMNHLVFQGRQGTTATALIIKHTRLQEIIEKYSPASVYDFAQLLPRKENTIVIAIIDNMACIMCEGHQGVTIPTTLLPMIMERELRAHTQQTEIELYTDSHTQELVVAQLMGLVSDVIQKPLSDLKEQVLRKYNDNKLLNLLTDQYAQKVKSKTNHLVKFKFPAAVAASLFFISLSINWMQASSFNAQADAVLQSSKSFYATLFPEDNVSRMKKSFGEYMKDVSGGETNTNQSFSNLLGSISSIASKEGGYSIDSVRYTNSKGALEINLTTGSIAQLDKLKKQLNELSLTTEIASANQEGDKIKGVIKVSKNG